MNLLGLAFLLFAGFVAADIHEVKSYHGHQVLSVRAINERQVSTLQSLQKNFHEILFLDEANLVHNTEMVVPPELRANVLRTLNKAGMKVKVVSSDLQQEIDAEKRENTANLLRHQRKIRSNGRLEPAHNVYYNTSQVNDIMLYFEETYPTVALRHTMQNLSQAYEQSIYYMEIGTRDNTEKPVIFIEGLAHAREWIVTATLIYAMDTMLSSYAEGNATAVTALTSYTWIIIPVLNPDGYDFTFTNNRMWRKNLKYINEYCFGVDLNRNFDVNFGIVGASTDCWSEVFHGGSPFSETETLNIKHLFGTLKSRVVAYLSVHAYSQLLLYPWGYVKSKHDPSPPSNINQLITMGEMMREQLKSEGGTWDLGTAFGVLGYAASGASEDWALTEKDGIYAYCLELRPRSFWDGGFIISTSNIKPSGRAFLRSLFTLSQGMETTTM